MIGCGLHSRPTLASTLLLGGYLTEALKSMWLLPLLCPSLHTPCQQTTSPDRVDQPSAIGVLLKWGEERLPQWGQGWGTGLLPATEGNMKPDPPSLSITHCSHGHKSNGLL